MSLLYIVITIYFILNQINYIWLMPYVINSTVNSAENVDKFKTNHLSNETSSNNGQYSDIFCRKEEYLNTFISLDNKYQIKRSTWMRTNPGKRLSLRNTCSVENGLPIRRLCDGFAQWESFDNKTTLIECRLSMFCRPEVFEHYVIKSYGEQKLHQNIWKRAEIGEYSSLRDICLQPNGLHLTRKCFYDAKHQRARWASIDHLKNYICLQNTRQKIISKELNVLHENITSTNLLLSDMTTRRQTVETLLTLIEKPKIKLLPADVHLSSEILKSIVTDFQDAELSHDIFKITNNLMSTDPVVLRMSAEINVTSRLLEIFENYMDALTNKFVSNTFCNVNLSAASVADSLLAIDDNDSSVNILNISNIGVFAHITRNISVFYINPNCAHISGIAIYDSYLRQKLSNQLRTQQLRYNSFHNFYYRFIYLNESIEDLLLETDLELASFIPDNVWFAFDHKFRYSLAYNPVIVFKIYAHDGLFVEQDLKRARKPFSKILSISIPGYSAKLPAPIPFILRNQDGSKQNSNTGCGYWNYSTWISSGVHTNLSQYSIDSNLILCSTNHLTQFSYLLGGSFRQNDLNDEILITDVHKKALDLISVIGCSLSLFGLLGIWITAALFSSWRSQSSNKILLNMCLALTLQMVLFLFVNTNDVSEELVKTHSYTRCVVFGALMQYSILFLFTWMLIVAFLQFQRYVTIIGVQRPKHYILKAAIVAWVLPLIPTLMVALLDAKSYIPSVYQLSTNTGICYPSGPGLYYGVILPVSLIVAANLVIFVYVFYSISHTLSMSMWRNEKQIVIKQIRLSIFLFFLMGLSWIFGIFAFMKAGIFFSYLFCLTATLQGFVLFIYFVVIDKIARSSWQRILSQACSKKSRQKKKSAELQSMTTATMSLTSDMRSSNDN